MSDHLYSGQQGWGQNFSYKYVMACPPDQTPHVTGLSLAAVQIPAFPERILLILKHVGLDQTSMFKVTTDVIFVLVVSTEVQETLFSWGFLTIGAIQLWPPNLSSALTNKLFLAELLL